MYQESPRTYMHLNEPDFRNSLAASQPRSLVASSQPCVYYHVPLLPMSRNSASVDDYELTKPP